MTGNSAADGDGGAKSLDKKWARRWTGSTRVNGVCTDRIERLTLLDFLGLDCNFLAEIDGFLCPHHCAPLLGGFEHGIKPGSF